MNSITAEQPGVVVSAVNRADLLQRAGHHHPPPPGVSDVLGLLCPFPEIPAPHAARAHDLPESGELVGEILHTARPDGECW
jgi:hypothetical protein